MPHRGIDHQRAGEPLVVSGKAPDVASQVVPRLWRQPDPLFHKEFQRPNA